VRHIATRKLHVVGIVRQAKMAEKVPGGKVHFFSFLKI
jgi:hypothetical protein